MNSKESKVLMEFPHAIDAAIEKKFGIKAQSGMNFFGDMKHYTNFETDDEVLKIRVADFVDGWIAGNVELRERLQSLKK